MRRLLPPLATGLVLLSACADDATRTPTGLAPSTIAANSSANAIDVEKMDAQDLPKNAHVFFAHGQAGRSSKSPNLTYHGGPVMTSVQTLAIFWGSAWNNASFAGDKITGMDAFYTGFSGSAYAGTNTEYTDAAGHHVTGTSTHLGHYVDASSSPTRVPSTADVLAEVCTALSKAGKVPQADGYYPVYVSVARGHLQYCAWHSHGPCGGTDVQFGLILNLDGDASCDPGEDPTATGHSQGLAAIANVSGHELSEAVTDPDLNAWYDASGAENSDKCAWAFSGKLVTLKRDAWTIQGNWSNAAYDSNKGYANTSGQNGCLDGNQKL